MDKLTPREQGFFMPAEWECHEGTWLQWPHDDTHKGSQVRLEHLWVTMTAALHEGEIVHIIVPDERRHEHLLHQLSYYGIDQSQIDVHAIPTDDVWSRDNGPIFLISDRGELSVTSWNFNGWGERYPYQKDRRVPLLVSETLNLPLFTAPITLEGGAIEVNGAGILMATRTSIVNPNRNAGMDHAFIDNAIQDYLGVEKIIWLTGAPREFCDAVGDDTDLHIDLLARFVEEATVLYAWTENKDHPFYPYLEQHLIELQAASTQAGKSLSLVPLLLPENRMYSTVYQNSTAPFQAALSLASYANFYIANQVVLVPIYGDVNDARALGIIGEHFPKRQIIPIPAQAIAQLGGMMHCITQQQPVAPIKL